MKCPKCHYLSFDPEPRCRNCGYDLELSGDLALKTVEDAVEGPLADLALRAPEAPRRAPMTLELVHPARVVAAPESRPEGGVAVAAPEPPPAAAAVPAVIAAPAASASPPVSATSHNPAARREPARAPASTPGELPLFVRGLASQDRGDDPMVVVPAVPRAPLSVRRGMPEAARARPRSAASTAGRKLGPLDRDLLEDLRRVEREQARAAQKPSAATPYAVSEDEASMAARLGAAAIDGLLLAGIGAVVLVATLRVCGLAVAQITALPLLPLAAFQLVVTIGYLLMFTIASGQTVGKMLLGIRVVAATDHDHGSVLTIRQAAYREVLSLPLVMACGAGYVPAVLGRGQAVHDRLAATRVVRA